jgi:hypothetical protein
MNESPDEAAYWARVTAAAALETNVAATAALEECIEAAIAGG